MHTLPFSIRFGPRVSIREKLWLSVSLLTGLLNIHSRNIVHGNIRSSNCGIFRDFILLLMDFSLKGSFYFNYTGVNGVKYINAFSPREPFFSMPIEKEFTLAPERLLHTSTNVPDLEQQKRADVFSAGCVIAAIFGNGLPLFTEADLPYIAAV